MSCSLLSRVAVATGLAITNLCADVATNPAEQATLDPAFERFVTDKWELAKRIAKDHDVAAPPIVWNFFDAAQKGDWQTCSNHFQRIEASTRGRGSGTSMPMPLWGPVHDIWGAYEQFHSWSPRLLHRFGDKVMARIPKGSIYFGGTDPGRFVISALSASHSEGRPFFTVTQNALADATYLEYLRDMYGTNIYIPTLEDSQQVFQEYVNDAQKRLEKKQLKEDESVQIVEDRVQVSGVVAVMAINELLARVIIDRNPTREVFLEESYALETLYGQSLPHGLIFKVNRQPLKELPRPTMEADRRFWKDECRALIGDVVQEHTSVPEICAWSQRVYLSPGKAGFDGDLLYVKDAQAPQYFSQCRSAIAAYYDWWSRKSAKSESVELNKEADFAHRQAIALSPFNPAVVFRYAEFLLSNQRTNDAKVLIQTMLKIDPAKHMEIDSEKLKTSLKKLKAKARELAGGADE
jgi:hypothetical protein